MYVDYQRTRSLAQLGASASISAEATAMLGAPTQSPEETFQTIVASSPKAQEIEADWMPAITAARDIPMPPSTILSSTSSATGWMLRAMPVVMAATGIGGPAAEIANVAQGFAPDIEKILAGGSAKPIVIVGIKAGVAYGCNALGISPELGVVTVEALQDGEITSKDFEAAGGVGGAIGGSALCAVIGVPPCIGGFVGGLAGQAVGGVVAQGLKIGGGRAEREAKRQELLRAQAAIRGSMNALRDAHAQMIDLKRGEWWSSFDRLVDNFSMQWQGLECNVAHVRFPLLWRAEGAPISPWFSHPSKQMCQLPLSRNLSRGTGCLDTQAVLSTTPGGVCAMPYGCPYPTLPAGGAPDAWNARVISAFAAYDVWWVPASLRAGIDRMWIDSLPRPDSRPSDPRTLAAMHGQTYTEFIARRTTERKGCKSDACRGYVDRDINVALEAYRKELSAVSDQALSFEGVVAAGMRVSGDITQTAAVYAAAQQVNAYRSDLLKGNLSAAVARSRSTAALIVAQSEKLGFAARRGRIQNSFINYGTLAAGAALLGAAALGGRRP